MPAPIERDRLWGIQWITRTRDDEWAQFGLWIQKKAETEIAALHQYMEDFYGTLHSIGFLGYATLKQTRILEWESVQQKFLVAHAVSTNQSYTGNSALPWQLAAVLSIEADVPLGGQRQRYQNRAYFGPISQSAMIANGRMNGLVTTNVLLETIAFHELVRDLEPAISFNAGFRVYSNADEGAHPAERAALGDVFDTQRRRRQGIVENRSRVVLPAA